MRRVISIHAPLAGCDWSPMSFSSPKRQFQSTHPLRGATHGRSVDLSKSAFQSTHPLRGATIVPISGTGRMDISIHAPLAGCDFFIRQRKGSQNRISIHAPLAGCDALSSLLSTPPSRFQSTHPLRGATLSPIRVWLSLPSFQSTHPLRGATATRIRYARSSAISIHAPLAGCDEPLTQGGAWLIDFNPRTPCGVRPRISSGRSRPKNFNPRTPCGVRRLHSYSQGGDRKFQSTHPLRGATITSSGSAFLTPLRFQSTHPLRGATSRGRFGGAKPIFQSTHPLRGATRSRHSFTTFKTYFNPRTPCGVRPVD